MMIEWEISTGREIRESSQSNAQDAYTSQLVDFLRLFRRTSTVTANRERIVANVNFYIITNCICCVILNGLIFLFSRARTTVGLPEASLPCPQCPHPIG
jgi:hypothetical protein